VGWVTYGASDIRIEPSLVQTAMTNEVALCALRRTIAHEIGHAMSGHRFNTAAMQQAKELEADAKGMSTLSAWLVLKSFGLITLQGLKRGFNIDAETRLKGVI